MKAAWILSVSILLALIAVYLHEQHLSTLMALLRKSSCLNSIVISVHSTILSWFSSNTSMTAEDKRAKNKAKSTIIFSDEELKKFTGQSGLYLSILGKVYDVGKDNKHYKPGGDYHFFTGRDASRAFITGDFTETGLTSEVLDLSPEELKSLADWAKFYKKQYKYKGKLTGLYYDSSGKPTQYLVEVQSKIKKAIAKEEDVNRRKLQYPPCNVEWNRETGSRVWCSTKSGGIDRDWVGSPRKFYEPGSSSYRCACVNLDQDARDVMSGNFREYEGCDPTATSCIVNG